MQLGITKLYRVVPSTLTLLLLLNLSFAPIIAQEDPAAPVRNTEVDFLLSYYQQDGNNSPVTGGVGTEELKDIAPIIIVNVPMANNRQLSVTTGVEFYTSASSDNVDPARTGASGSDARAHLDIGYGGDLLSSKQSWGLNVGVSAEYDYTSLWIGGNWGKSSANENTQFSLAGRFFFDQIQLIYPIELRQRGVELLNENRRQTLNFSTSINQVLTKKMQASVSADFVYQQGLLSTPFHRVYFANETLAQVERLPDNRLKLPVALRLNYYWSDFLVSRLSYRFYYDDFGINANTFNIEVPMRINQFFAFSPFYRHHTQTAADYFAGFQQHASGAEFYTSDFDLSAFDSHKYGIGIRYYPLEGLGAINWPFSDKPALIKRLDARFAYYTRSDGLDAFTASFGISFVLK